MNPQLQQLPHPDASELDALLNARVLAKSNPSGPLEKLKRSMRIGFVYAIAITLGYVVLIISFPIWQVQLSLLIVTIFNTWMMSTGYMLYRDMNLDAAQNNLLTELKRIYNLFRQQLKEQYKAAILVYPIAATGGFVLGGVLGSGKTVAQFFGKPVVWVALVACIAVLIPAGLWLVKKLNQAAYGKYLDQLKEQIDDLEGE